MQGKRIYATSGAAELFRTITECKAGPQCARPAQYLAAGMPDALAFTSVRRYIGSASWITRYGIFVNNILPFSSAMFSLSRHA